MKLKLLEYVDFLAISWIDILDIALVSWLLFTFYKLIRGTMAFRVFTGFLMLYVVYLLVQATHMELLAAVLGQFMGVGVLIAAILFQQELKKFFLVIGESTFLGNFSLFEWLKHRKKHNYTQITEEQIIAIIDALRAMSHTHTGALIVLSSHSDLTAYVETGDVIDGNISKRLILSIFYKNSPLHDGAMIIIKGRIRAARCILPVTENLNIPASMGLRHRAAVGMSEATNTLILIVSEETGNMSVARSGRVFHDLSPNEIREQIEEYFADKEHQEDK